MTIFLRMRAASGPSAPGPVQSLATGTPASTSMPLTWSAPASDGGSAITDYIVQYKLTSEPTTWTTFSDGVSAVTGTTVTGLVADTSYDFRVAAINSEGTGPYATPVTDSTAAGSTAATLVGTATGIVGWQGNASLVMPTLLAGDLIIVHVAASSGSQSTDATHVDFTAPFAALDPANSYRPHITTLTKIAVSGDSGATIDIVTNAAGTWAAAASVWRGAAGVRAINAEIETQGTVVDAAAITPVNVNDTVAFAAAYRGGTGVDTGIAPIVGYTPMFDNDPGNAMGLSGFYDQPNSISQQDPPAQTTTQQHNEWSAVTYLIEAA